MVKNKKYSIIIPAHNEALFIRRVIFSALKSKASEIIVVNDGSTDATLDILGVIKNKRLKIISHKNNRGYCASRKTGIRHSVNDVLVFFDGDVVNPKSEMFDVLARPVINNEADYVIGKFDNFGRISEFLARPLTRYFVPKLSKFRQPLSGLVAIRKRFIFPEKMIDGYGNFGILLDAYFAGARFREVDLGVICHDKRSDEDKSKHAEEACRIFFDRLIENKLIKF